ncbi:hypothetical protein [Mycobacterium szulgai]|uniref:hypothetical protein n=1 Tax=Mycobacterium szulgai TaxID=1787 RepID=UPI0021F2ABA8|nr:hypothetical protein [Mycobacterium szulgai]MCV7074871.1 hypothetical protein [Mycobacterium szulgai]
MPLTFQIRPLGSLPWPAGLGKHGGRYRRLEDALRALLATDDFWNPEAHRRAFVASDSDYRRTVLTELKHQAWSADLLDGVDTATALARTAPLLNQPLESESSWLDWAAPHRTDYPVWAWLTNGLNASESEIADGRHRLTYLRYHRPLEHEVLVRIET